VREREAEFKHAKNQYRNQCPLSPGAERRPRNPHQLALDSLFGELHSTELESDPRTQAMDVFEAVKSRRSIRAYSAKNVNNESIEMVLRAAMAAPSAGNEQPWEFLLIRNRETLERISAAHPYAEMVRHAPVAILVCGNLTRVRHQDYWVQDLSAATENMLLAAHALGLGSVWVGIHPREKRVAEIRSVLSLPEEIIPFAILPIGHPGEEKPPEDRYDAQRVYREQWGHQ